MICVYFRGSCSILLKLCRLAADSSGGAACVDLPDLPVRPHAPVIIIKSYVSKNFSCSVHWMTLTFQPGNTRIVSARAQRTAGAKKPVSCVFFQFLRISGPMRREPAGINVPVRNHLLFLLRDLLQPWFPRDIAPVPPVSIVRRGHFPMLMQIPVKRKQALYFERRRQMCSAAAHPLRSPLYLCFHARPERRRQIRPVIVPHFL